jgi:hypothetical protein
LKKIKIKRFDDKFINGFIAGIIAALITGPISFAAKHLNLTELELADFSGILALGKVPESLAEMIFSSVLDLMVSGALGIIFAFLVPYIGSRYLWFKGWFVLGALWFIYYPLIIIGMLQEIDINVQTHVINGIIAGFFGLVLAMAYSRLHRDIQVKSNNLKDRRKSVREDNSFKEEIAAPITIHPFTPPQIQPAAPVKLRAVPDNWTNNPLFEVTWTNPEHHALIVGAYYKLGVPPTGDTDGIYVSENPFTVTAEEEEQHVYVWLQDEDGQTAYQNAAFIILKYDSANPSWSKEDALKVTNVMAESVTLKWPPASDTAGNIKYLVSVNDVFVGETDNTTYIVSSLEPGTRYTFSVVAEDRAGNRTEFPRAKKVRTLRTKKRK